MYQPWMVRPKRSRTRGASPAGRQLGKQMWKPWWWHRGPRVRRGLRGARLRWFLGEAEKCREKESDRRPEETRKWGGEEGMREASEYVCTKQKAGIRQLLSKHGGEDASFTATASLVGYAALGGGCKQCKASTARERGGGGADNGGGGDCGRWKGVRGRFRHSVVSVVFLSA